MKKLTGVLRLMVLLLAACGGTEDGVVTDEDTGVVETNGGETAVEETAVKIELQADYANALSVQSQLALGTLKLEESDQVVSDAQAADLYPLWSAYQALGESDITAGAELTALLGQIQDNMTAAQLEAIAALALTDDDVTAMLEDGTLTRSMAGSGKEDGETMGSGGGGGGGGTGVPGAGGGSTDLTAVDLDAQATRRAEEFGDEDPEVVFQEMLVVGAVTQLMGIKTGDITASLNGYTIILDSIAAELGMDVDTLRAETAVDATLADIITANGGDVDAMHALLLAELADSEIADTQDDMDAFVTEALNR